MTRNYANTAFDTVLIGGLTAGALSLAVADATGYPAAPFAIVVDPGSQTVEEVMLVTAVAGTTWTITRGYDGTAAVAHNSGATVRHAAIAADFTDLQAADATTAAALAAHAADTTAVHGITDTAQIAFKNVTNIFTRAQTIAPDTNAVSLTLSAEHPLALLPVLDDFNRANAATLGANWSVAGAPSSWTSPRIVSNRATAQDNSTYSFAVWNGIVAADVGVTTEIGAVNLSSPYSEIDVVARYTDEVTQFYEFSVWHDTTWQCGLYLNDASGSFTLLGSIESISPALVVGDAIGLIVRGTTIEGWVRRSGVWALMSSVTDATITAAGKTGLLIWDDNDTFRVDNFAAAADVGADENLFEVYKDGALVASLSSDGKLSATNYIIDADADTIDLTGATDGDALLWSGAAGKYAPGPVASGGIGMVVTSADNTGATNAAAQLQTDYTTAVAAGHKRLYLPAGTYKIALTAGDLFTIATDGVEIFGDGIGKTILQVPASTVLTNHVRLFHTTAWHTFVHDLSIQFLPGASGSFNMYGFSADTGCFYPRVQRVEVSGIYGGLTAGGSGLDFYQTWNQTEVSTTLGTTIAAGTRTVTPPSMRGIYVGKRLTIGGTTEDVVVTAITETTFTATFANAHNAANSVTLNSQGNQYAWVEDCIIRDSYKASGIVVNCNSNTFRRCILTHIGSNALQHGFYIQGGYNLFEDCRVEGAAGYSYHGHKDVVALDGAGDRFIGCVSLNPGTQHFLCDFRTSDGTNPLVPSGKKLTRYVTITNCVFRDTDQGQHVGVQVNVPALIANNVFEDVIPNNAPIILVSSGGSGSSIIGNLITTVNPAVVTTIGIRAEDACTIADNTITIPINANVKAISIGSTGGNTVIRGNRVTLTTTNGSSACVSLAASNVLISDNAFSVPTNGLCIAFSAISGLRIQNNFFSIGASAFITNDDFDYFDADIVNNVFSGGSLRYTKGSTRVRLVGNLGGVSYQGQLTTSLDSGAGLLLPFTTNGVGVSTGRLMKLTGGQIAQLATTDTVFVGVTPTALPGSSVSAYIVGRPGDVFPGIETDGAWVKGNIGVPSTTSAGKIHDSGSTTPPASGSYVLFLDAGGAAGNARCLLLKTL